VRPFGFCLIVLFAGYVLCLGAQDRNSGGDREPGGGTQEEAPLFDDIDSLFEEPPSTGGDADLHSEGAAGSLAGLVRQRGFVFDAAYEFHGGAAPGWSEAPWYRNQERTLSYKPGAVMRAVLGMDMQISDVFRVKTSAGAELPEADYFLQEFFFDYNLFDAAFVRGGRYDLSWGVSPNYAFANLLARVPPGGAGGDSYILKIDVPVGIGGLQALLMTRGDFVHGAKPQYRDTGFGGKYNLALPWADIDFGAFYQSELPLHWFTSVKSTIGNTEVYADVTTAIQNERGEGLYATAGTGFVQAFFNDKLTVNGEIFYNGEEDVLSFESKTSLEDEKVSSFIGGLNGALNMMFRPGGMKDLRFFINCLYSLKENSVQLVPGLRFSPLRHVEVSLAIPMALGSRDSFYYSNNADKYNRPFSVVLLVSLTGNFRYTAGGF
jgi:hypothetical protein